MTPGPAVPMHLGQLHAYETLLLGLLAFGPFVVLAVVVFVQRQRDSRQPDRDEASGGDDRLDLEGVSGPDGTHDDPLPDQRTAVGGRSRNSQP